MSAGGDILWTSMIPGLHQLELALAPKHEVKEGTAAQAAPEPVEPAIHVSGAVVIFILLFVSGQIPLPNG